MDHKVGQPWGDSSVFSDLSDHAPDGGIERAPHDIALPPGIPSQNRVIGPSLCRLGKAHREGGRRRMRCSDRGASPESCCPARCCQASALFQPEQGRSRIVTVGHDLASVSRRGPLHRRHDLGLEEGDSLGGAVAVDHLQAAKVSAKGLVDGPFQFPQGGVAVLPGVDDIDLMHPAVAPGAERHPTLWAIEPPEGLDLEAALGAFGGGVHGVAAMKESPWFSHDQLPKSRLARDTPSVRSFYKPGCDAMGLPPACRSGRASQFYRILTGVPLPLTHAME